jgi:hypothetical protein
MGTAIPDELIIKRYKDEDGEIFLEIIGMDDVYVRATPDNRYYYKIEKSAMQDEELTLVNDYSVPRPDSMPEEIPFSEQPTAVHRVITQEDLNRNRKEETHDPLEDSNLDGTETFDSNVHHKDRHEEGEPTEWQEGQTIPAHLKSQCTPNDYGGFTFRFNKFLYMLDGNYKVEIKTPDTNYGHVLEAEPHVHEPASSSAPYAPPSPFQDRENGNGELQKGDILPFHYRDRCEEDIGPGGGIRVSIGSYLYFLDENFKVIQKMKISSMEDDFSSPLETPQAQPAPKQLSTVEVIENLVNTFQFALQRYHIAADYFKESVLGPGNRDTLILSFKGDLSHLNDDTREAAAQGKNLVLQENGFTFMKAVIIHELYIKSTLSGRGDNMAPFLTHAAAAEPDGTLGPAQENVPLENIESLMTFFKNRAEIYEDKADIILRIHRQIGKSIAGEYNQLISGGEKIRFDAFLITKLYEHTTRMDRGDGITMIRLVYSILKFWRKMQGS